MRLRIQRGLGVRQRVGGIHNHLEFPSIDCISEVAQLVNRWLRECAHGHNTLLFSGVWRQLRSRGDIASTGLENGEGTLDIVAAGQIEDNIDGPHDLFKALVVGSDDLIRTQLLQERAVRLMIAWPQLAQLV